MLVAFGKPNIRDEARQQSDKVRAELEKVKMDDLATTLEAIRSKFGPPIALGYAAMWAE